MKPAANSKHQTRYLNFHNWVPVIQCPNPERWRWGKAPRDYRGLRKIWIAEDLTRKSRTQIKPAAVVKTPIPSLGLAVAPVTPADAGADGGADAAASKGKCGCRAPGSESSDARRGQSVLAFLLLAGGVLRRKSRSSRS